MVDTSMQKQVEEEKEFAIPDEDSGLQCCKCQKAFSEMPFDHVIYLEDCNHFVCKTCLKEDAMKFYPEVMCPEGSCNQHIHQ